MALILVIEDDEPLRQLIRNSLVSLGHQVLGAENGRSAIAMFSSTTVDLVITDILLPDKDGLELIPQFRKSAPSIKIIAISGGGRLGAKSYLGTAKALGALKTLAKPFSSLELQNAVKEVLDEKTK